MIRFTGYKGESLQTLRSILKEVKEELIQKDDVRENAQKKMRKASEEI